MNLRVNSIMRFPLVVLLGVVIASPPRILPCCDDRPDGGSETVRNERCCKGCDGAAILFGSDDVSRDTGEREAPTRSSESKRDPLACSGCAAWCCLKSMVSMTGARALLVGLADDEGFIAVERSPQLLSVGGVFHPPRI
jgi:hypothetical protein